MLHTCTGQSSLLPVMGKGKTSWNGPPSICDRLPVAPLHQPCCKFHFPHGNPSQNPPGCYKPVGVISV